MRSFQVIHAASGEEAIQLQAEKKPDLILMDLSLPVMDGYEATRQIRSQEAGKATPIIALTAHALQSDLERAIAAGCNDFDTKPVDMKRLMAKIQGML
jgi:CheY-like chemotaxis protein